MISALRKIEGRGELPGATSAVMEMCVDNPRQGFGELFDTHPSVESRVAALVKFAGGHDPGPLALPDDMQAHDPEQSDLQTENMDEDQAPVGGPWRSEQDAPTPAPAARPPAVPSSVPTSGPISGPWGPHRD
jgi:heat shock protein HtpX